MFTDQMTMIFRTRNSGCCRSSWRSDVVTVSAMMLHTVILLSIFSFSTALVNTMRPIIVTHDGSATSQNKNCIIVGGGPIGLATALTLARPPHSYNVTVLEATSDLTSVYDPTKSYLYNVNPRGLQWFLNPSIAPPSAYEGLLQKGYTPGIGSMGKFYAVPADPSQVIPHSKQITMAASRIQQRSKETSQSSSSRRPSYWIPRHQLNEILYDCCNEHNSNHNDGDGATTIQVLSGKSVCHVHPSTYDTNLISVQCDDGDSYTGALIVAADGINSVVRSTLAGLRRPFHEDPDRPSSSWLQSHPTSFRVRKFKSPATGLKFKAIQFKPHLTIPNRTIHHLVADGTIQDNATQLHSFTPDSTDIVSVRGQNTGFRNRLSLGFLPMKDPNMIRLGNTIAPYDHEIWKLQNGTDAQHWFTRTFPRLLWNDSIIHESEWDRYVQTRATTFPYCQYSPGSAVASPNGLGGVVMVGDSCHAFPPDVGQGVNSGLQDVVALDRALRNVDIVHGDMSDDDASNMGTPMKARQLGTALLAYQTNRRPEHAALIRIARFGGPYQYRQPWLRHRIGAMIWTMNFLFRTIMNKLSFGFIPSAIITTASDPSLTYRQVMRRADCTAFGFQFVLMTFFLRWIQLRWPSLTNTLLIGVPVEVCAACAAFVILKGILPCKDQLETFWRRERYVGKNLS